VHQKTKLVVEKGFKVRSSKEQHSKLLNEITEFPKKNSLIHHSDTSSAPAPMIRSSSFRRGSATLISGIKTARNATPSIYSAKDYMYDKFGDMKTYMGYPQAKIKHEKAYLDDIANGRWKTLKRIQTLDKCQLSNFPEIKNGKYLQHKNKFLDVRATLFREVRGGGIKLKHVDTVDKCVVEISKDFKLKFSKELHEKLMNEIREFGLRNSLKSIEVVDKAAPKIEGDVKIKKAFVAPKPTNLLNNIRSAFQNIAGAQ